jgi:hypothetical protein
LDCGASGRTTFTFLLWNMSVKLYQGSESSNFFRVSVYIFF